MHKHTDSEASGCKPGSVLRLPGVPIIYLGRRSPGASSNLPPGIGRATLDCRYTWSCNPRDVLSEAYRYLRGGLLPRLFTLARRRFVFCGTVHTRGFAPRIPVFQPGLCSAVPGLSSREKSLQRMPAACQNLSKNSINQNYLAKNSLMQSHT